MLWPIQGYTREILYATTGADHSTYRKLSA